MSKSNGTDTGGGIVWTPADIGAIVGSVGGVVIAFLGLGSFVLYKFKQAFSDQQTSKVEFIGKVSDPDGSGVEIKVNGELLNKEIVIVEEKTFDNRQQDPFTEGVGAVSGFISKHIYSSSPANHQQSTGGNNLMQEVVDNTRKEIDTMKEVTKTFAENNHLGDVEITKARGDMSLDICNLALKFTQISLAAKAGLDPTDVRSLHTHRVRDDQDNHAIKSPGANKNKKPAQNRVTVSDEDEDAGTDQPKKVKFDVPKIIIQPQEGNKGSENIEAKDNPKPNKKEPVKEDMRQVETRLEIDGIVIDPQHYKPSEGKGGKKAQPPSKVAKLKVTTGSAPDDAPTTRVEDQKKKPLVEKKTIEQQGLLSDHDEDGVQVLGDSTVIQITPEGQ